MTLVLCTFTYVGQLGARTQLLNDVVVIKVNSSAEILDEFEKTMRLRRAGWNFGFGPRPLQWTLKAYWPEHGRARF